jgi:DNA-binding NarL/FixJ family response regulator
LRRLVQFRVKHNSVDSRELTAHKLLIIELLAAGLKNTEIGRQLGTTRGTVANLLCVIYDLTGLSNRVELALWWQAQHPTRVPRETLDNFEIGRTL